MKKLVASFIIVSFPFIFVSCKKQDFHFPGNGDKCSTPVLLSYHWFADSANFYRADYSYDIQKKVISGITYTDSYTTTSVVVKIIRDSDNLIKETVLTEGNEIKSRNVFTYSGSKLTRVQCFNKDNVLFENYDYGYDLNNSDQITSMFLTEYENEKIFMTELFKWEYNADGTIKREILSGGDGIPFEYVVYEVKGKVTNADHYKKLGLPIDVVSLFPNPLKDPGVGSTVEYLFVNMDDGSLISQGKMIVKSKELHSSGYASVMVWKDVSGDFQYKNEYNFKCPE